MYSYTSTLSNNDRSFIEFTRCLYKTKSVVQELQQFSQEYPYQYMEESFKKFYHMCKVLLIVLTKLETNHSRECIDSFRQEVVSEWKKVAMIRQDVLVLIQQRKKNELVLPSPISNSEQEENDDEQQESDTSIEPITSDSSS